MKWYWYFFRTENRNWTEFYHLKNIKYQQIFRFLLSGILVPVIQSNGTENFDRSAKSGKKVILRKVSPFFHRDASRSIWSLPGITGFSVQKVSALLVLPHKKVWEVVVNSVLQDRPIKIILSEVIQISEVPCTYPNCIFRVQHQGVIT